MASLLISGVENRLLLLSFFVCGLFWARSLSLSVFHSVFESWSWYSFAVVMVMVVVLQLLSCIYCQFVTAITFEDLHCKCVWNVFCAWHFSMWNVDSVLVRYSAISISALLKMCILTLKRFSNEFKNTKPHTSNSFTIYIRKSGHILSVCVWFNLIITEYVKKVKWWQYTLFSKSESIDVLTIFHIIAFYLVLKWHIPLNIIYLF